MPARGSADQAPMVVLAEVLAGGNASSLYLGLVKGLELTVNLDSLWGTGGPWDYDGPTLFTLFAMVKPAGSADAVLAAVDAEIARLVRDGVDAATLARVKTSLKADWYNGLESFLNRADTLAKLQAVWGDAQVVNRVPHWIDGVTSAQIQRVAATYLTAANRSVIDRRPTRQASPPADAGASAASAAAVAPTAVDKP
jgi:predicted Zn-dependent peptidase